MRLNKYDQFQINEDVKIKRFVKVKEQHFNICECRVEQSSVSLFRENC